MALELAPPVDDFLLASEIWQRARRDHTQNHRPRPRTFQASSQHVVSSELSFPAHCLSTCRPTAVRSGARPLRWRISTRSAAGLVIGEVRPEEIDPHSFQLFGAIVRERLDVLPSRGLSFIRSPEFGPGRGASPASARPRTLRHPRRGVVEKSHLPRCPRADRLAR